ncbi:MAG: MotA/TolQ/ExbB proton channel family protein [Gammaproteobacteria bacterium]
MSRKAMLISLSLVVFFSAIILLLSLDNIWLISIAGLFFVAGGTVLTTLISESSDLLFLLSQEIRQLFHPKTTSLQTDLKQFERIAESYRVGQIRHAESLVSSIIDTQFRKGVRMVIDGFAFDQVEHQMYWSINSTKEEKARRLQLLQVMIGLAPAFGMLGTLLGLVQLLFNLSANGVEQAGASMGFAMITTFYGLLITNVLLKPVTLKLEKNYQLEIRQATLKFELVKLLYQRESMLRIQSIIKRELSYSIDMSTNSTQSTSSLLALTQTR